MADQHGGGTKADGGRGIRRPRGAGAPVRSASRAPDFYPSVFAAAGLAIWSIEGADDLADASPELAQLVGVEPGRQSLGALIEALAVDNDVVRLRAAVAEARASGRSDAIIHHVVNASGGLRLLRTTFSKAGRGARGKYAVLAATQEISDIVGVGELSRRRILQVAESTRRSPGPVAMFDGAGRYVAASPEWVRLGDLVGRDYLGRNLQDLRDDVPARVLDLHRRAAAGENLIAPDERLVGADGVPHWLQCEYRPVTAIDGSVLGYLIHGHDISPLVEARRDAQENAERLGLALHAARAGVHVVDYTARTFWCSPEFVRLVGRTMTFEEASNDAWPMTHPDDVERVREQVALGRDKARPDTLEMRVVLPSGDVRWVEHQTQVTHDADGRPVKAVSLVVDIDSRKRQELALLEARTQAQASAERLSLALDAASAGVFETDFANRTFWCSPEFTEIIGRTMTFDEAAQRVWHNVHPDDRGYVNSVVEKALASHQVTPYETRLVLPSGESRWIEMSAVVHMTGDGRPSKVVGLILDIDARKRQELALEETRQAAQTSADRLKIALAAGQAGVFETDFKKKTFWCSPQFAEIMGRKLTFEEASRRSWPMTHPEDADAVAGKVANSKGYRGFGVVQSRVILPSGEIRWVDTCAELHRDANGDLEKVVGLILNIDERKRQELALVEAERAAQAAAEAKSQFLANMSHEIRTPMNGVLGVLHLLDREPLSPWARNLLNEALGCGQMLAQLLNDVIDFSKIEAGRLELSPEPLNVSDMLNSVVGLLRPQAEAKGLQLRASALGADGWILVDPVRIRQALFNLIGNAVKFTTKGYVDVRLYIRHDGEGAKRVRFEVQDTGVGIAEAAQPLLFQRFHQADGSTARQFGGSGLGLAITRTLAEMMGGEVGFVSREGEGSTFWFDVPAPSVNPAAEVAVANTTSALGGLKILVVEDNATNRLVASKILEGLGAIVETAEDGVFGVEAVQAAAYDLVLMDIQMPRMDGMEATRRIRDLDGPVSKIPVIGLTANALAHQRPAYIAAGMDGLAAKPISPAALLAEISRVLNGADCAETSVAV